jgi:O-antigen/teichoic acid export membrane protein
MDIMLSLKKNIIYTLAGNLVYNLSQWGWLVVLAKLTDKESIGVFALALAIVSPVFLFSSLQLRSLYVTDASDKNSFSDYSRIRMVFSFFSFLILILFALITQSQPVIRFTIIAVSLAKLFESMSDMLQGIFQKKYRMDVVSVSLVLKGLTSLVFSGP